jgi:hypothetical protein
VKEDILVVFKELHSRRSLRRVLMQHLSPLSKNKPGVVDIKDFWPISLVGGAYKIISKVLAK